MLGLTRREAHERFDDVIAFAELEEFLDLKLKNYSSGMAVRLAFSVAVQVDADIILVDEVLAVGDAAFQRKCFDQFDALKAAGKTIVFVTHDMSAVERFCDRAMLLERGRMRRARRAARRSRARTTRSTSGGCRAAADGDRRRGPRAPRSAPRGSRTRDGKRVTAGRAQASRCALCMEVAFHDDDRAPALPLPPAQRVAPHDLRDVHRPAPARHRRVRRRATRPSSASRMENWLAPGPLLPVAHARAPRRRARRGARRAREPRTSIVVEGARRLRRRRRHPAHDRDRARAMSAVAAARAPAARTSLGARPPPLLEPDVDARGDRLQAALLRLGARLRVDARAAVPVLRRHLLRVLGDRRAGRERRELRRLHTVRARAVPVLRRGDERLRALPGRAREHAAQDALPAAGDPAVGRAHRDLQPRRRRSSRCSSSRSPPACTRRWALARAAGDRPARRRCSPPASACCCRRCSSATATCADLGGRLADALLRLAGPLRRDARARAVPASRTC